MTPSAGRRVLAEAMPASDWDALFAAVVARLRSHVAPWSDAQNAAQAALCGPVLDCAVSLELLHASLRQARADQQVSGLALLQAQAALAAAQHELVGTREGERRAHHLAQHDSLTALPNRRCFSARLNGDLRAAQDTSAPLAVLFVDLDGFKQINDQHGHDAGDQMLRIVAGRLRGAVRSGDMVGRLGGDEFACLLPGPLGRVPLAQLARKLFDAVSAPLSLGALRLRVRPSIGIAQSPENGHTADTLLKRADAAMYRAKRQQSGYAFFEGAADAVAGTAGAAGVAAGMGAQGAGVA